MILPYSLILLKENITQNRRSEVGKFILTTLVVALVSFYPVIHKFGLGFVTLSQYRYPDLISVLSRATVEVWGVIGCLGIGFTLPTLVAQKGTREDASVVQEDRLGMRRTSWIAATASYAVLFFALPGEAGYLIPMIPFVIVLAAQLLPRRSFLIFSISIILSSFFLSVDSLDRPWSARPSALSVPIFVSGRTIVVDFLQGPLLRDHERRLSRMKFVERVLEFGDKLTQKSVIVSGVWLPQIVTSAGGSYSGRETEEDFVVRGMARYVGLLNESSLRYFKRMGYTVRFLTSQDRYNEEVTGINLQSFGASEVRVETDI